MNLQSQLFTTVRLLAAAVDYDASCEPDSRRHLGLNFVLWQVRSGSVDGVPGVAR